MFFSVCIKAGKFFFFIIVLQYLLIDVVNRVGYNPDERCLSFLCSEGNSTGCLQRIDTTVNIRNEDWCPLDEFCFVTDRWDGTCITKTNTMIRPLYSGERCNSTTLDWGKFPKTSECAYGPQK